MSLLNRITETDRPEITILIDGVERKVLLGDTVLTAILIHGKRLRESEFGVLQSLIKSVIFVFPFRLISILVLICWS